MRATSLRCEYLTNPMGIDEVAPRLSWLLEASQRGERQTAYRVLVATGHENLEREFGDLWDSGRVDSDRSAHVVYQGAALRSRMSCPWKVRVWDANGTPSDWSETAFWTMGLLRAEDWQARWIGLERAGGDVGAKRAARRRLPARYLRTEFVAAARPIRRATAFICGLGYHELYLNGARVGDHQLDPILRDYDVQVPYVTHDATGLVRRRNAIGVVLGNGRYYAPRLTFPEPTRSFGFPKLFLQLEIEFVDGSRQLVVSDERWRITDDGPIRSNNDYDGEDFDARREMPGWNEAGFDATGWRPVETVAAPGGALTSAACMPPMRVTDEIAPRRLTQPRKGVWVFDMGQNMVGRCRLTVSGPRGARVTMRFAENLYPDGTPDYRGLRSARCADRYTLSGAGQETYSPSFTYHGFRYVAVTGFPGAPTLETLTGEVINSDLPLAGDFSCSNETINRILRNARWGIRGNYLSIPTDCPQRDERHGWQGDRAAGQMGETFLFDNITLYEKWLGDIRDSQRPDGNLSDVCPNYWPLYDANVTWPSAFLMIPGAIHELHGDPRAIARNYDSMKRWIAHLRGFVQGGIIDRDRYGDWCCPPEDEALIHTNQPWRTTPAELLATGYYYHDLRLLGTYAELLGRDDDAREFLAESRNVREAFDRGLYDADEGCYGNGSQTSQIIALSLGLVPEERRGAVFAYLARHIETRSDGHLATGLVGGQWLMRTLSDNGRIDLAYRLATNRDYPSWGYMIERGATTIWELWNGDTADPEMSSSNHVMLLGDVITWMFEYLAGIRPDPANPGFKHIVLRPDMPRGLTQARATYDSVYGRIVSDWRIDGDRFAWKVTVPVNTTATVYVPARDVADVSEGGKPAIEAGGVTLLRMESGRAVLSVASGDYAFKSRSFRAGA